MVIKFIKESIKKGLIVSFTLKITIENFNFMDFSTKEIKEHLIKLFKNVDLDDIVIVMKQGKLKAIVG